MNSKSYERHDILNSNSDSNLRPFNSPRWRRLYAIPPLSSVTLEALFRLAVLGLILLSVALTAYARAEDRVNAARAGFQQHIAKPVEPAELIAVIANLARRR